VAIIKTSLLSKKYKDLVAVNSISLEIAEGECFGLSFVVTWANYHIDCLILLHISGYYETSVDYIVNRSHYKNMIPG